MNGVYLYLLLREIKPQLFRRRIVDFVQNGRLIQLVLDKKSLFISLYPEARAVYLGPKEKRDFKRIFSFYNILHGAVIKDVQQESLMPVFKLLLNQGAYYRKREFEFLVSLYYSGPNIGYRRENVQHNLYKRFIQKEPKSSILELTPEKLSEIEDKKELVKSFEGIDKSLAQELTSKNLVDLKKIIQGRAIKPRLIESVPLRISLFAKNYIKKFDSLNELYQFVLKEYISNRTERMIETKTEKMRALYKKEIERLKKALLTKEEIEDYRIKGELILANLQRIKKGSLKFEVINPYTQEMLDIKLEPEKKPQENAQAYFARYKKLKRSQPRIKKRIEELEEAIGRLDTYKEITQEQAVKLKTGKLPYHKFILESGSIIFVGKNARSNEIVTFKLARPDDYIFHTRAYEGSHTVLRARKPKGQNPPDKEIRICAGIAAYFSKARKQRDVLVSYTQRKYIKKNKKGGIGSIIFMREKVVAVDPIPPSEIKLKS